MAATIKGTFELIDRASSTLKKIEAQALKTQAAVEGVGTALDNKQQGGGAAKAMGAESRALNTLEQDMKDARRATDDLAGAHRGLSRQASTTSKGLGDFSKTLSGARREVRGLTGETHKMMTELGKDFPLGGGVTVFSNAYKAIQQYLTSMKSFASQKSTLAMVGTALKGVKEAFAGLGPAVAAVHFGGMMAGIPALIGGVQALGAGLIALLPKLAQAGQAILALPAAGSLVAQGFGVMKLATNGVGNALSVLLQNQANYAMNAQQFSNQIIAAQTSVITSQQGLTSALYNENQAQIQLMATRQQAARSMQDLAMAARTSILEEASAGLSLQQAQLNLQQAMMTPGTTQIQLEQDKLAVYQAQAQAQQSHTQALRSRQDYQQARTRNPISQVTQQLAQAQHAVAQSTIEVGNAQRSAQLAQRTMNQTLQNGSADTQAYRKALNALGPAQVQFVKFLQRTGAVNTYEGLQAAAGAGLFPALEKGLKSLLRVMPQIDGVATRTGKVLGDAFTGVLRIFSDPHWITNVGDKNVSILSQMSKGFESFAKILKELIPPGQQFISWLVKYADLWLGAKAKQDAGIQGFDRLTAKFHRAESAIKTIMTVLKNLWDTFKGIARASTGLGNELWSGMEKGTKKWSEWANSQTGQKSMKKYFDGMLPTLRAVGRLVAAIAKGFVQLGSGGNQSQSAAFFRDLTKLIPSLTTILGAMGTISNALSPAVQVFAKILADVAAIVGSFLKIKPLAEVLGLSFALVMLGRFVHQLDGVGKTLGKIGQAFRMYHRLQGGLATPGTTGHSRLGNAGSAFKSVFGGGERAIQLSTEWGWKSAAGPGSMSNPLVVLVKGGSLGGGGSGGLPASAASEEEKIAAAAAGDTGAVRDLGRMGAAGSLLSKVPLVGRFASKLPGALGEGAAAAAAGEAVASGGIASALTGVAGVVSKALPLLGAVPGIVSFISAGGSVGNRLAAAGNTTASMLTLGLVNHLFTGTVSKSTEAARGQANARKFLGQQGMTASGMPNMARIAERLAALQTQYNTYAHGRTVTTPVYGRFGLTGATQTQTHVGMSTGGRQQTYAGIIALNKDAANQSVKAWTDEFSQGIQSGATKPQSAMQLMLDGMKAQMADLGPSGKTQMLNNLAAWGQQIQSSSPQMQKPVSDLNAWITNAFGQMGSQVQIVNGQILTGSTTQWQQIGTALTNPIAVAQEKLQGSFGTIQKTAVGALVAMGMKRNLATTLVQGVTSGNLSAAALQSDVSYLNGTNKTISGYAYAAGGRVAGSNMRDAYVLGGNMVGGGELVLNQHHEAEANARLMRHGEPTVGSIVANRNTPHWENRARGGRTLKGLSAPAIDGVSGVPGMLAQYGADSYAATMSAALRTLLGGIVGAGGAGGGGGLPSLSSGAAASQIAGFFRSKGLSNIAIAGIIGNWMQESSLNSNLTGASGLGLAQWIGSRRTAAEALAAREHVPATSMALQLQYAWSELTGGYSNTLAALQRARSATAAAQIFESGFEGAGIPDMGNRIAYANSALSQGFAGGGRIRDAGWFGDGGRFTTSGPTVLGVGERGKETVTVTKGDGAAGDRPVQITIHKIEVNRKGDVQKIVDEELRILANSLKER